MAKPNKELLRSVNKMYKEYEGHESFGKPPLMRIICHPSLLIDAVFHFVMSFIFVLCVVFCIELFVGKVDYETPVTIGLFIMAYRQYLLGVVNVYSEKDIRLDIAESSSSAWAYANMVIYYLFQRYGTSYKLWMPLIGMICACVSAYRLPEYQEVLHTTSVVVTYMVAVLSAYKIEVRV